ncbi:MAG: hypothetical protein AAFV46_03840, partial [Cyanobacteria bacterium J06635_11]
MSLIPPPRPPKRFLAIALSLGLPLLVAIPAARGQALTAAPEAASPEAAVAHTLDDRAANPRALDDRAERLSPLA